MLKGNAVVVEWLTSPFAYCRDEAFREAFLALAQRACDRRLIGRHYYHLAANQLDRLQVDQITIPLKKLFYSLRPLMALKWLDENPQASVAPMHFPSLCAGVELSASVRQDIDELMARKAETREMGSGPIPPSIRAFLNAEFDAAKSWRDSEVAERPEIQPDIDAFWREWTDRLALA
jgi:predicted nucleotidyltransferase